MRWNTLPTGAVKIASNAWSFSMSADPDHCQVVGIVHVFLGFGSRAEEPTAVFGATGLESFCEANRLSFVQDLSRDNRTLPANFDVPHQRLMRVVANIQTNPDQSSACIEITNDFENPVAPAIGESTRSRLAQQQLPSFELIFADLPVEFLQIAVWTIIDADFETILFDVILHCLRAG